jgi:hypothetical protein
MTAQDRKANALRLLEGGTDFDGLQVFFGARLTTAINDFCSINPSDHGALAAAQGHIREIMNYRDFKATLERIANQPDPPKTG